MSSYLTIKKDSVLIGCWSRNTEMYQAFHNAPYGTEEEFDPTKEFKLAEDNIKAKIKDWERIKAKSEKVLELLKDREEIWEEVNAIEECDFEIEMLKSDLSDIHFMIRCHADSDYDDEVGNKWTWSVD